MSVIKDFVKHEKTKNESIINLNLPKKNYDLDIHAFTLVSALSNKQCFEKHILLKVNIS